MYLDIGNDWVVSSDEIIAILDVSHEEIQFHPKIKLPENQTYDWILPLKIDAVPGDDYKSLVITNKKNYASPISTATLKKRMQYMMEERK